VKEPSVDEHAGKVRQIAGISEFPHGAGGELMDRNHALPPGTPAFDHAVVSETLEGARNTVSAVQGGPGRDPPDHARVVPNPGWVPVWILKSGNHGRSLNQPVR